MHPSILSFTKDKRMHLSRSEASNTTDPVKALYKQVEAMEKQNGCSQRRGSFTKRSLTRMYFERWGLLAPPPEKASFPKDLPTLLFPQGYYTSPIASVQLAACWRAGVQETVIYHIENKTLRYMTHVTLTQLIKKI